MTTVLLVDLVGILLFLLIFLNRKPDTFTTPAASAD